MKAGLPTQTNVLDKPTTKEMIINYLIKMRRANYSEETIERYTRNIQTLANRGADITNPTSIQDTIASLKITDASKQVMTNSVLLFYKLNNQPITMTKYKAIEKIPFMPLESELDQLVSGCKHQLATFLQILKETASRYGEAFNLKWTDYNVETLTLSITPEKEVTHEH